LGFKLKEIAVSSLSKGNYAALMFEVDCKLESAEKINVDYSLLFDTDTEHSGVLNVKHNSVRHTVMYDNDTRQQAISLTAEKTPVFERFVEFVGEGVWHIAIGLDHILFVVTLLLPAVYFRQRKEWVSHETFFSSFKEVLKVVTAFTIAHSITLCLATLGVVDLPARIVESVIAVSVIVASVHNLFPVFSKRLWVFAFGFGLVHGFGFASVLGDLGLQPGEIIVSLAGFNIGVEIGQMFLVAVLLPLLFAIRNTKIYYRIVFVTGSVAAALIGVVWTFERIFNLSIIS